MARGGDDVLADGEQYVDWWPVFVGFRRLSAEIRRLGERAERSVRGRLPYPLRYVTTVTKMDRPREVAYDAEGDLTGHGRFVLEPRNGGTVITFYWDVRTTGWVMNLLAPLFAWNHNQVMERGQIALIRHQEAQAQRCSEPCPNKS
jgi:hypothetical protein